MLTKCVMYNSGILTALYREDKNILPPIPLWVSVACLFTFVCTLVSAIQAHRVCLWVMRMCASSLNGLASCDGLMLWILTLGREKYSPPMCFASEAGWRTCKGCRHVLYHENERQKCCCHRFWKGCEAARDEMVNRQNSRQLVRPFKLSVLWHFIRNEKQKSFSSIFFFFSRNQIFLYFSDGSIFVYSKKIVTNILCYFPFFGANFPFFCFCFNCFFYWFSSDMFRGCPSVRTININVK